MHPPVLIGLDDESFVIFQEGDIAQPFNPGALMFCINFMLLSGDRIECKNHQGILTAVHPLRPELLAVRRPERSTKILILLLIKIGPDHVSARNRDEPDPYDWVRIT